MIDVAESGNRNVEKLESVKVYSDTLPLQAFTLFGQVCYNPAMRGPGQLDSFGTILSGLAKRLGLQSHLFELHLQQQWRDLLGEPIASHTWPAQVRFKKLYLIVRNSVWLQQLVFLKPTLLAKLNERAGSEMLTDIAFRVGEIPDAAAVDPDSSSQPVQVSEAAMMEARAHAAAVQDPELRHRLTSVMAEAFSRPIPEDDRPGSP